MENLVEQPRVNVKTEVGIQSAIRGRKVCVTGHTGFKGAWLCEWLLNLGAEVAGFSLPEPVATPSLFEQLGLGERLKDTRGDVRDRQAVVDWMVREEPDFMFHLAAQPLVRLSYREPVMTWETNVLGTIHVMEGLRRLTRPCAAILITTDKVYENREWLYGYREVDPLGGRDPYSSSKAATEIAIASWRDSFFRDHPVRIASARAGNVIGGGDWAEDRIVPDLVRALQAGRPVPVRNKRSTRPWQHVLEPLSGYLLLAARLSAGQGGSTKRGDDDDNTLPHAKDLEIRSNDSLCSAFNFGPHLESNRTVKDLVEEALKHWPGRWEDRSDPNAPHEAGKLNLVWDKAHHVLGWSPRWSFAETVEKTVAWYREAAEGADPTELTRRQIAEYSQS
ncbi:MAG: CDP-glucose 4,6-dehydratase [Candidatus Methylacidiphilales bacterium]